MGPVKGGVVPPALPPSLVCFTVATILQKEGATRAPPGLPLTPNTWGDRSMKLPASAYETGPLCCHHGDVVTPAVISGYSETVPLPYRGREASLSSAAADGVTSRCWHLLHLAL